MMKSLSSVSQRNRGQEMNPSLSWNRGIASRDHMTLEHTTERGYGIPNPAGFQEQSRKISILEVHHFLGPNDCFRSPTVL